MPSRRRGYLLLDLLLALTLLGVAAGPTTWLLQRALRALAEARARGAVAEAALVVLAQVAPAPCIAAPADVAPVAIRWWREGGAPGRFVVTLAAAPLTRRDTLSFPTWCLP